MRLQKTIAALASTLLAVPVLAGGVAGTYRCWQYNVSGGGAGSCRLVPALVLREDGTYQSSSERGTYRLEGDRLELSESKLRGPGRLVNGNQILFEYDYRGWHHSVTYLCQDCAASGRATPRSGTGAPAAGPIRVDLRLRFPQEDGVYGWFNSGALIPSEAAAEFRRSGRLPAGGAEGIAYGSGRREVALAVKNAQPGRDYVVFLSSGLDRIPVARLDLTGASGPLDLVLDATLDPSPAPRRQVAPAEPPAPPPPAGLDPAASPGPGRDAPPCNPNLPHYRQKGCREISDPEPVYAPPCDPRIPHYQQQGCRQT